MTSATGRLRIGNEQSLAFIGGVSARKAGRASGKGCLEASIASAASKQRALQPRRRGEGRRIGHTSEEELARVLHGLNQILG